MNPRVLSPVSEPISLPEARAHLNLDADGDSPPAHPDDPMISALITAARQTVENYTERRLALTQLELATDRFPWCGSPVQLPGSPLLSIDSVAYQDADGNTQTLDPGSYTFDSYSEPGWFMLAQGAAWPTTARVVNAIKIRYTAGYAPADVPGPLRSAMLLLLGHLYENREAVTIASQGAELPLGVQYLLRPYKLHLGY